MAVPTSINDLSTTAASNSPAGGDSIGNTADDFLRAIQAIVKETGGTLYTAGGTGNAMTVTTTPTTTAYATGNRYIVKASASNTSAVTLNVNSLGAKSVKKSGGAALVSGDIISGDVYLFVYDGTNFVVVGSLGQYAITLGGALTTAGTLNTAGAFATSGANSLTLTTTGSTNVTLPTSGTLATTGNTSITGVYDFGTTGSIKDAKTLSFGPTQNLGSAGLGITITLANAQAHAIDLNLASTTVTIDRTGSNTGLYYLWVKQDATGGRAVTWSGLTSTQWLGSASAPAINTTANSYTLIEIFNDGGASSYHWQRMTHIGAV